MGPPDSHAGLPAGLRFGGHMDVNVHWRPQSVLLWIQGALTVCMKMQVRGQMDVNVHWRLQSVLLWIPGVFTECMKNVGLY